MLEIGDIRIPMAVMSFETINDVANTTASNRDFQTRRD